MKLERKMQRAGTDTVPPSRIVANESGQSMVLIAIALVGLIAFVGLALDGANAYQQRTQMQTAADSAAMAGAREVILESNQSTIWSRLNEYAVTRNLASSFTATYYPGGQSLPSSSGTPPTGALGTCVTTTVNYATDFIPVIGIKSMTVEASACAAGRAQSGVCGGGYVVWANNPTCTDSLVWSGKSYNTRGTVQFRRQCNRFQQRLSGCGRIRHRICGRKRSPGQLEQEGRVRQYHLPGHLPDG
jgi:Flp pilus assembly protein TadG